MDMIEEMKTGQVRFSDRDQYLDILNQWADETGDRQIGKLALNKVIGHIFRGDNLFSLFLFSL